MRLYESTSTSCLSFDVATTLGLSSQYCDPPERRKEHIVLRVPAGVTVHKLRDCEAGFSFVHRQEWYESYEWAHAELPAGIYHVRCPVPDSERSSFSQQLTMLRLTEKPIVPALALATLLCIAVDGASDPLNGGWLRCDGLTGVGRNIGLDWNNGRILMRSLMDCRSRHSIFVGAYSMYAP